MAADDSKRQNCVKVCFTDREYIDLGRCAARERRKVAEMVRFLVCKSMYGMVDARPEDSQGTETD